MLWDFGSVVVRLTEPAGSVVRPNLTEPLGSAEPEPEPNGSVAHYSTVSVPSFLWSHSLYVFSVPKKLRRSTFN